jgi:hypothetical protein
MTSEEALKSKLAFEKFSLSHGVHVKHYHADNGRFKDNLFTKSIEDKGQTINFCGVGAHHQNGIAERRIGEQLHFYYMHKEDGQMQLTLTYGPMPSEQPMIVGMKMTPVPCQDFVQPVVYQQSKTSIILDVKLMF